MISRRYSSLLFGFILSMIMTFIVSGVSTVSAIGVNNEVYFLWGTAWLRSWIIAFPVILLVAPITRKLVAKITY